MMTKIIFFIKLKDQIFYYAFKNYKKNNMKNGCVPLVATSLYNQNIFYLFLSKQFFYR